LNGLLVLELYRCSRLAERSSGVHGGNDRLAFGASGAILVPKLR
jgi:hypothetical protein